VDCASRTSSSKSCRRRAKKKATSSPRACWKFCPTVTDFCGRRNYNYLPGPDDIYVSPSQIRKFDLKTGDTISGQVRPPHEGEKYFALVKIEAVNFESPDEARNKILFDNLTPLYPQERLKLETTAGELERAGDGFADAAGQGAARADCFSAARRQNDAAAECGELDYDEPSGSGVDGAADRRAAGRVTDMQRSVKGEVISSTFDEPAARHVQVAEMVIEKRSG